MDFGRFVTRLKSEKFGEHDFHSDFCCGCLVVCLSCFCIHAILGVWFLLVLKRKWGTRIWLQIVDDSGVVDVVGYNQIQQQLFGHSAAAHQSGLIGIHDFSAMNKQYRVILKQSYAYIEGRSKETISKTYMEEKKPGITFFTRIN
ncbi:uncharacterized protein LOC129597081 [Paramacrobiotus metropolitanus]|uniref:uncharacterized protein LOC129597081 n=1 Tax=Paramacrobiotus metropolitanus TaxID=2943436 RepID=UPI002445C0F7|nr:uncharacterized protein LOC129597081 [Paramacrobiotus metropolitanus]